MSKISKLGLGIVAFDDTCHLRNITEEIREHCDLIVVCLQKLSYHGDPISDDVIEYVTKLKEMKLIDEIIWFESTKTYDDKNAEPRLIETDKRNFILDYLEKNGCSHSLITDSDEFYDADDFKTTKDAIDKNENIHVSYCQYVNYYRDYRHVLVWPFLSYVPFISESSYRFDFNLGNFSEPSDPTRRYRVEGGKFVVFSFKTIKMHHLSWIRLHIEDKIKAWSAKKYFSDYDSLCKRILERYYNYEDGMNAIIMFNVPNNEVVVNLLPEQYIHPKHRIDEPL